MPPKKTIIADEDGKVHVKSKDDYRYVIGVYLGIKADSSDSWIGTPSGSVISARSLRRISEDHKWSMEDLERTVGLPWDLKGERGGEAVAELEVPERAEEIPLEILPKF